MASGSQSSAEEFDYLLLEWVSAVAADRQAPVIEPIFHDWYTETDFTILDHVRPLRNGPIVEDLTPVDHKFNHGNTICQKLGIALRHEVDSGNGS